MAFVIDQLNAVTKKYFDSDLQVQCYDDSPFWVKLKSKNAVKLDGGVSIQYPIRYQKLGFADATDPDAQLVYETKATRTGASQDWAYYYSKQMMTWDEKVKNAGKEKIVDLAKEKVQEMKDDQYHRFATDLWTSNPSGNGITPLSSIVDSADTFAGITVADASTWASWEDASTTVLSLYGGAGSLAYYHNLATLGKNHPTMMLTTRNLYSKFMSLFEGQRIRADNDLADAGFDSCMFLNAAITSDSYVPSGDIYALDLDHYEFIIHSGFNFKLTDWFTLEQQGLPNHAARVMSFAGNLKCDLRRTSFKMTALDWAL